MEGCLVCIVIARNLFLNMFELPVTMDNDDISSKFIVFGIWGVCAIVQLAITYVKVPNLGVAWLLLIMMTSLPAGKF